MRRAPRCSELSPQLLDLVLERRLCRAVCRFRSRGQPFRSATAVRQHCSRRRQPRAPERRACGARCASERLPQWRTYDRSARLYSGVEPTLGGVTCCSRSLQGTLARVTRQPCRTRRKGRGAGATRPFSRVVAGTARNAVAAEWPPARLGAAVRGARRSAERGTARLRQVGPRDSSKPYAAPRHIRRTTRAPPLHACSLPRDVHRTLRGARAQPRPQTGRWQRLRRRAL